jgi:putative membrane protein
VEAVMWGGHMIGWGGMFGGWHVVWWLVLVVGAVAAARWLWSANTPKDSGNDRAMSILRERFARGEIDKAEFDARKRDLG